MNQNLKNVIIFTGGVLVGAASMYVGVKKYFELKADLEIEQVRKAYDRKMESVEGTKSSMDGDIKGPEEIDDDENAYSKMKTKSSIVKELNNKPPMENYARYFKSTKEGNELGLREVIRDPSEEIIENELAEKESPEDDEEMTDEEEAQADADFENYQMNKEHQEALREHRMPYVIEASDFDLNHAHYSKISLHYYIHDDIIVTDEDEIVDTLSLLGNCIESSGFNDNDEDLLFVRNDINMADYEIEKLYTEYTGGNN